MRLNRVNMECDKNLDKIMKNDGTIWVIESFDISLSAIKFPTF